MLFFQFISTLSKNDFSSVASSIYSNWPPTGNPCDKRVILTLNVFNKLILDQWSGPYESSYGHHLIFLNSRKDGFNPDWIEIKNQVLNDYFLQSKEDEIKKYLEEIKSEYKVVIDPNFKY